MVSAVCYSAGKGGDKLHEHGQQAGTGKQDGEGTVDDVDEYSSKKLKKKISIFQLQENWKKIVWIINQVRKMR